MNAIESFWSLHRVKVYIAITVLMISFSSEWVKKNVLDPRDVIADQRDTIEELEQNATMSRVDSDIDITNVMIEIETNQTNEEIKKNAEFINAIFEKNATDSAADIFDRVFLFTRDSD